MNKFNSEKIITELAKKHNLSIDEAIKLSVECLLRYKTVTEIVKNKIEGDK